MTTISRAALAMALGMGLALGAAAPAAAKGIPIVYEFDSYAIEKVADLPKTAVFDINGRHFDMGYSYKAWSLYWMPFWASDAEGYVLYADTADGVSVVTLTPAQRTEITKLLGRDPAAGHSFSLLAHIWGWAVVAAIIAAFVLYVRLKGKSDAAAANA